VYVPVATALDVQFERRPIALIVVDVDTDKGPVYSVDASLGVEPSTVK
jgi:hypothetical protein